MGFSRVMDTALDCGMSGSGREISGLGVLSLANSNTRV